VNPVLLISVDGMRPDGLMQADTPCMDRLIAEGASTMRARTVMPSITLPCHTSMLRGVDVPRHGITSNVFQPLARPVPSLFDVAHSQGRRTAMFYNWGELRDLADPGSVSFSFVHNDPSTAECDWIVARACAQYVAEYRFDLTFLYLGYTDLAGHDHGWMSGPYLNAIANADRCIEHVLSAYSEAGRQPNLLLLSDHGGHDRTHGTDMDEDILIPWIMHGPTVRAGVELGAGIRIFHACEMLAKLAGVHPVKEWEVLNVDALV